MAVAFAAAAAVLVIIVRRSRPGPPRGAVLLGRRLVDRGVRVVTGPNTFHRFFDSSPFSPSGRYLVATRTARGGPRDVAPLEAGAVVVYDLVAGGRAPVYERATRAWDAQLGAQAQWGATDDVLYLNDVAAVGPPLVVRGVEVRAWSSAAPREVALDAPIYHVSRDGRYAVSPLDLAALRLTQPGYGVVAPSDQIEALRRARRRAPAPADDGVVVTDLATRTSRVVATIADLVDRAGLRDRPRPVADPRPGGRRPSRRCGFHAFHVKLRDDGGRIMVVLRERGACARGPGAAPGNANHVLTMDRGGGGGVRVVATWLARGSHPNWLPDGRVSMNFGGKICAFADAENATCAVLSRRASGHPAAAPRGGVLVADTYAKEGPRFGLPGGASLLRRVLPKPERDLGIFHAPGAGVWRCDLHPAFDRTGERVAINIVVDGARRVAVLNVTERLRAQGTDEGGVT